MVINHLLNGMILQAGSIPKTQRGSVENMWKVPWHLLKFLKQLDGGFWGVDLAD